MNCGYYMLAVFLFSGVSFTVVYGLQCYVCNPIEPDEADCGSVKKGDTKFLQNCTAPNNQSCRKITFTVKEVHLKQSMNGERTVRQCASNAFDPEKPCYKKARDMTRVYVCDCEEDECNEASRTASTVFLTAALVLLVDWFSLN